MRCPDENVLAGYVDGGLRPDERATLAQHVDGCPACRLIVSDLARMKEQCEIPSNAFATGRPTSATIMVHADRAIHLVPGTIIGEYEVTGPLGQGGMGAVFAAVHPRIGKKAAIKVLQRQLAGDQSAIARFENEARAVNAIGHPNIVDIFGFGELPDGNPYFVMELVGGESLDKWLRLRGSLTLEQAMPILRQIFDALSAAHARGIIHRDLKPGNIMIAGSETAPRIKVLDFGLAKMAKAARASMHVFDSNDLTNPGVVLGTPMFMSPEQHLGEDVDHRTDIYALGVIVYLMVSGEYPFVGKTPTTLGAQHISERPRAPSSIVGELSPRLDSVIMKALAKDPADRFASVGELGAALEDCAWASGTENSTTHPDLPAAEHRRAPTARPARRTASDPATPRAEAEQAATMPAMPAMRAGPTYPADLEDAPTLQGASHATSKHAGRRRSQLALPLVLVGSLVVGVVVAIAATHKVTPAAPPHEETTVITPQPELAVPSSGSALPAASPQVRPTAPSGPATAEVTQTDATTSAPPTGKRVVHKASTETKPVIKRGSGAGSGLATKPCNPYRSLDGC